MANLKSTTRAQLRDGLGSNTAADNVIDQLDCAAKINEANTFTAAQTFTAGIDVTGGVTQTGQSYGVASRAKVGTTAGWVVGAANDLAYMATLPQSQTASTLVIPIDGLHVGDTITGFHLVGQIEGTAGAVTLDADLRKHVAVAADPSDASVGAITQIAVSADTKVDSTQGKTGLEEVVAQDATYYLLLTGTTAASTDIALLGCYVTVTRV